MLNPPKRNFLDLNNIDINKLIYESTIPLELENNVEYSRLSMPYMGATYEQFYEMMAPELDSATDLEKWKYIAICSTYWLRRYEFWNETWEYKDYKRKLVKWSKKNPDFLKTLEELEAQESEEDKKRFEIEKEI